MDKIVFICTGNTCRSPMAEGLFKAMDGENKTGLKAVSAGVFTVDNLPASEYAITASGELGADISNHKSQVINDSIINDAKYIVCMTASHYDKILEKYPDVNDKLFTLMPADVDDPYGGTLDDYRKCASQIQKGISSIIERLKK